MVNEHTIQYQKNRFRDTQQWYDSIVGPMLARDVDTSVRYALLWMTFNSLYNVLDMPNRKPSKPYMDKDTKTLKPSFRGNGERTKIKNLASKLGEHEDFVQGLYAGHKNFAESLADRVPDVRQSGDAEEITYYVGDQPYPFRPKDIRGIASLDNRCILNNGYKVFEYESLELDLEQNRNLRYPKKFIRQLLLVLYQLRNNVVHGGSAGFFYRGNKVSDEAINVLDEILHYLFDHRALLMAEEET